MKRHQISTAVIVLCAGVSNVSWAQASVGPEPLIPLPALSAADSVTKLALSRAIRIPSYQVTRVRRVILTSYDDHVRAQGVPSLRDVVFAALDTDQVQTLADQHGTFHYLKIGPVRVSADTIAVPLGAGLASERTKQKGRWLWGFHGCTWVFTKHGQTWAFVRRDCLVS